MLFCSRILFFNLYTVLPIFFSTSVSFVPAIDLNIFFRFMSHVRHKIENEWKENDNVNDFNICNHCYRHYSSPFHLQCHIETVHATVPAASELL